MTLNISTTKDECNKLLWNAGHQTPSMQHHIRKEQTNCPLQKPKNLHIQFYWVKGAGVIGRVNLGFCIKTNQTKLHQTK